MFHKLHYVYLIIIICIGVIVVNHIEAVDEVSLNDMPCAHQVLELGGKN